MQLLVGIFHSRGVINMTTQIGPCTNNNVRSVSERSLLGCIAHHLTQAAFD